MGWGEHIGIGNEGAGDLRSNPLVRALRAGYALWRPARAKGLWDLRSTSSHGTLRVGCALRDRREQSQIPRAVPYGQATHSESGENRYLLLFHGLLTVKDIWPLGLKKTDNPIITIIYQGRKTRRPTVKPSRTVGRPARTEIGRPAVKFLARYPKGRLRILLTMQWCGDLRSNPLARSETGESMETWDSISSLPIML